MAQVCPCPEGVKVVGPIPSAAEAPPPTAALNLETTSAGMFPAFKTSGSRQTCVCVDEDEENTGRGM